MRAYGKKKGHTHVAGHQNCGICHPTQKNQTTRARREGKVVRSSRRVSMDSAIYRPIPDGEELEIEVEVTGTANPYWPGNYDNPPEGGDVEDIAASFYDEAAKTFRDIPLTDEEVKQFAESLADDDGDEPDCED